MVDKTSQYIPHNSSPCGFADKYWNILRQKYSEIKASTCCRPMWNWKFMRQISTDIILETGLETLILFIFHAFSMLLS